MSVSPETPHYKRILLKLSGEALTGKKDCAIDPSTLRIISSELHNVHSEGIQLAIVIGGGNIIRGADSLQYEIDRVTADYMGMTATVINALALKNSLITAGSRVSVMNAFNAGNVCEPYNREKALKYLDEGRIIIFSGGTGNPYFSTDTAASLRAAEIKAQVLLKATQVDGVYDKDPVKEPGAKFFKILKYHDVLNAGLQIMDLTAISLAMEQKIPIIVFNINIKGNIKKIVYGHKVGTQIAGEHHER